MKITPSARSSGANNNAWGLVAGILIPTTKSKSESDTYVVDRKIYTFIIM